MIDNEKINENTEPRTYLEEPGEPMALDDARRVKVLSPGMLVFKRFIRNKLAVVGLGIILVMFYLFRHRSAAFTLYANTGFKGLGLMTKDYASAIYNTELRYTVQEGEKFGAAEARAFDSCWQWKEPNRFFRGR